MIRKRKHNICKKCGMKVDEWNDKLNDEGLCEDCEIMSFRMPSIKECRESKDKDNE